jgi:hypothetical protein
MSKNEKLAAIGGTIDCVAGMIVRHPQIADLRQLIRMLEIRYP